MMFNIPAPERPGISHVPPEILSEIFVHCLPLDSASHDTQQLLSSICRLWRTLVLATPALWASLDITCNSNVLRPPLPIIRTHLQRSGAHPFSFILREDEDEDCPEPRLPSVLTALTAARPRWRNVYIELCVMTQEFADFITIGDAPLFQSIECDVRESHWVPIPLHILHRCPRLELFTWTNPGSPLVLPLGDTHLTSLSLRIDLSALECTTFLRLSPRLFSAEFHRISSFDPSPVPHLTHSTLCTLVITGWHSDILLDALTLPALQDLDLTAGTTIFPSEWGITLSAFIERSRPILRKLSLSMSHTRSRETSLLRMLVLTPHLRVLRLSGYASDPPPFTAALIRALHPIPPPGISLCPHLQRLYLTGFPDCPNGLCGAMLRARWGAQAEENGVACLELGDITLNGGTHYHDKADVEELRKEGMEINFSLW